MIEGFTPPLKSNIKLNQINVYFIFLGKEILLTDSDELPTELPSGLNQIRTFAFGDYNGKKCIAIEVEGQIPNGFHLSNLRATFTLLGETLFRITGRAFHLLHWDRTHQFCGVCGTPLNNDPTETAKVCGNCEYKVYPRISPAIIVAVEKGDKLLMAHSTRYPTKMFSVVAGFVEPGESLEECVAREVKEETNIEVKDIKYFGSQAWPFPDALMLGFTAKYAGGEIIPDGEEIDKADWFGIDDFPEKIPGNISISRSLINWFLAKHKKEALI